MEDKANVSKIVKSTLSVEVAGRIRQMIFNNELKPGERVIEIKLAREFGVSQSPIREAIRELEMMGILENVPFRGCVVKELTSKDIGEPVQDSRRSGDAGYKGCIRHDDGCRICGPEYSSAADEKIRKKRIKIHLLVRILNFTKESSRYVTMNFSQKCGIWSVSENGQMLHGQYFR